MRLSPPIFAALVVLILAACATLAAATEWEPVTFRGTRPTEYTYERLADGLALRADSQRTASGLVVELPEELDPTAISGRVDQGRCCPWPPTDPDVRVLPHSAPSTDGFATRRRVPVGPGCDEDDPCHPRCVSGQFGYPLS